MFTDTRGFTHSPNSHPDTLFEVDIVYLGTDPEMYHETHELIYTDGYVALTVYECCYVLWNVISGKMLYGALHSPVSDWKLHPDSLTKIKQLDKK